MTRQLVQRLAIEWGRPAARDVAPKRPLLKIDPERARAELRRACEMEEAERRSGHPLVVGAVVVLAWQLVGAGFVLASARTTDPVVGELLYQLAPAVGAAGGFFSAVVIYVRGAEHGEW